MDIASAGGLESMPELLMQISEARYLADCSVSDRQISIIHIFAP